MNFYVLFDKIILKYQNKIKIRDEIHLKIIFYYFI